MREREQCCCSSATSITAKSDAMASHLSPQMLRRRKKPRNEKHTTFDNYNNNLSFVKHSKFRIRSHLSTAIVFLLSQLYSLRECEAFSKSFVNNSVSSSTSPIFVINFDRSTVICQNSADVHDLKLHDISILCDGKLDCYNDQFMNDENFPHCVSGCEDDCMGRGACLYNGYQQQCFYNIAQRKMEECAGQTCHWLARCSRNSFGKTFCKCLDGFKGDGQNCVDVNECADGTAKCPLHSTCVNLPGSYVCQCKRGYSSRGSPVQTCQDIDECMLNKDICGAYEKCQNKEGSYECVRECGTGYESSTSENLCVDINECANAQLDGQPICNERAKCVNTLGGFDCVCENGFHGNGHICVPSADCTVNANVCDRHAVCVVPLKMCICQAGYAGDGLHCRDIDECAQTSNICSHNKKCINIEGGFICCDADDIDGERTCLKEQGAFCSGGCGRNAICFEDSCQCLNGFVGNPKIHCTDINECENAHACDGVAERCINTVGSYACCTPDSTDAECRVENLWEKEIDMVGFSADERSNSVVAADNRNSVIVNAAAEANAHQNFRHSKELSKSNNKHSDDKAAVGLSAERHKEGTQTTHEVREKKIISGGYVLLTRRRNSGLNAFGKQIDIFTEPQKCDIRAPSASYCPINAYCIEGLCKCRIGYGWNIVTRQCEDINECDGVENTPCEREHFCVNTVGSFRCCSYGNGMENGRDHIVNCSGIQIETQNFPSIEKLRHTIEALINDTRNKVPEPLSKNESILIDGTDASSSSSNEDFTSGNRARPGRLTTITYGEWRNFSGGQLVIRRGKFGGSTLIPEMEFRPFTNQNTRGKGSGEISHLKVTEKLFEILTTTPVNLSPFITDIIWSDEDINEKDKEDSSIFSSTSTIKMKENDEELETETSLSSLQSSSTLTLTTESSNTSTEFLTTMTEDKIASLKSSTHISEVDEENNRNKEISLKSFTSSFKLTNSTTDVPLRTYHTDGDLEIIRYTKKALTTNLPTNDNEHKLEIIPDTSSFTRPWSQSTTDLETGLEISFQWPFKNASNEITKISNELNSKKHSNFSEMVAIKNIKTEILTKMVKLKNKNFTKTNDKHANITNNVKGTIINGSIGNGVMVERSDVDTGLEISFVPHNESLNEREFIPEAEEMSSSNSFGSVKLEKTFTTKGSFMPDGSELEKVSQRQKITDDGNNNYSETNKNTITINTINVENMKNNAIFDTTIATRKSLEEIANVTNAVSISPTSNNSFALMKIANKTNIFTTTTIRPDKITNDLFSPSTPVELINIINSSNSNVREEKILLTNMSLTTIDSDKNRSQSRIQMIEVNNNMKRTHIQTAWNNSEVKNGAVSFMTQFQSYSTTTKIPTDLNTVTKGEKIPNTDLSTTKKVELVLTNSNINESFTLLTIETSTPNPHFNQIKMSTKTNDANPLKPTTINTLTNGNLPITTKLTKMEPSFNRIDKKKLQMPSKIMELSTVGLIDEKIILTSVFNDSQLTTINTETSPALFEFNPTTTKSINIKELSTSTQATAENNSSIMLDVNNDRKNINERTTISSLLTTVKLEVNGKFMKEKSANLGLKLTSTTEGVELEIGGKEMLKEKTVKKISTLSTQPYSTTVENTNENTMEKINSSHANVVTENEKFITTTEFSMVEFGSSPQSLTDVTGNKGPTTMISQKTKSPVIVVEETTEENLENGLEIRGGLKTSLASVTPAPKSTFFESTITESWNNETSRTENLTTISISIATNSTNITPPKTTNEIVIESTTNSLTTPIAKTSEYSHNQTTIDQIDTSLFIETTTEKAAGTSFGQSTNINFSETLTTINPTKTIYRMNETKIDDTTSGFTTLKPISNNEISSISPIGNDLVTFLSKNPNKVTNEFVPETTNEVITTITSFLFVPENEILIKTEKTTSPTPLLTIESAGLEISDREILKETVTINNVSPKSTTEKAGLEINGKELMKEKNIKLTSTTEEIGLEISGKEMLKENAEKKISASSTPFTKLESTSSSPLNLTDVTGNTTMILQKTKASVIVVEETTKENLENGLEIRDKANVISTTPVAKIFSDLTGKTTQKVTFIPLEESKIKTTTKVVDLTNHLINWKTTPNVNGSKTMTENSKTTEVIDTDFSDVTMKTNNEKISILIRNGTENSASFTIPIRTPLVNENPNEISTITTKSNSEVVKFLNTNTTSSQFIQPSTDFDAFTIHINNVTKRPFTNANNQVNAITPFLFENENISIITSSVYNNTYESKPFAKVTTSLNVLNSTKEIKKNTNDVELASQSLSSSGIDKNDADYTTIMMKKESPIEANVTLPTTEIRLIDTKSTKQSERMETFNVSSITTENVSIYSENITFNNNSTNIDHITGNYLTSISSNPFMINNRFTDSPNNQFTSAKINNITTDTRDDIYTLTTSIAYDNNSNSTAIFSTVRTKDNTEVQSRLSSLHNKPESENEIGLEIRAHSGEKKTSSDVGLEIGPDDLEHVKITAFEKSKGTTRTLSANNEASLLSTTLNSVTDTSTSILESSTRNKRPPENNRPETFIDDGENPEEEKNEKVDVLKKNKVSTKNIISIPESGENGLEISLNKPQINPKSIKIITDDGNFGREDKWNKIQNKTKISSIESTISVTDQPTSTNMNIGLEISGKNIEHGPPIMKSSNHSHIPSNHSHKEESTTTTDNLKLVENSTEILIKTEKTTSPTPLLTTESVGLEISGREILKETETVTINNVSPKSTTEKAGLEINGKELMKEKSIKLTSTTEEIGLEISGKELLKENTVKKISASFTPFTKIESTTESSMVEFGSSPQSLTDVTGNKGPTTMISQKTKSLVIVVEETTEENLENGLEIRGGLKTSLASVTSAPKSTFFENTITENWNNETSRTENLTTISILIATNSTNITPPKTTNEIVIESTTNSLTTPIAKTSEYSHNQTTIDQIDTSLFIETTTEKAAGTSFGQSTNINFSETITAKSELPNVTEVITEPSSTPVVPPAASKTENIALSSLATTLPISTTTTIANKTSTSSSEIEIVKTSTDKNVEEFVTKLSVSSISLSATSAASTAENTSPLLIISSVPEKSSVSSEIKIVDVLQSTATPLKNETTLFRTTPKLEETTTKLEETTISSTNKIRESIENITTSTILSTINNFTNFSTIPSIPQIEILSTIKPSARSTEPASIFIDSGENIVSAGGEEINRPSKTTTTIAATIAATASIVPNSQATQTNETPSKTTTTIAATIAATAPIVPNSQATQTNETFIGEFNTTTIETTMISSEKTTITLTTPDSATISESFQTRCSTDRECGDNASTEPASIFIDSGENIVSAGGEEINRPSKTTTTIAATIAATAPIVPNSQATQTNETFIGEFNTTTIETTMISSEKTTIILTTPDSKTIPESFQTRCSTDRECGDDAFCNHLLNTCKCHDGFVGEPPHIPCSDVDECAGKLDNCHSSARCQNTLGAFTCNCIVGYRKNRDGACEDINECAEQGVASLCNEFATCQNLPGFYTCQCNVGYTGDGYKCTPLGKRACTPAEWATTDCGRNHLCHVNTHGNIDCDMCKRGFRLQNGVCADIDECREPLSSAFAATCHANAFCVNLVGSYKCECVSGFAGDGFYCEDVDECNGPMSSIYQEQDHHANVREEFEDIVVVSTAKNNSGEDANRGSSLEISGSAMRVIEKKTPQLRRCHPQAICRNTIGSFECQCPSGWMGDGIRECRPSSNEVSQLPCSYGNTTNNSTAIGCQLLSAVAIGANNINTTNQPSTLAQRTICECQTGFRLNLITGSCEDIDECAERRDVCNSASGATCRNLIGGYACECAAGYEGVNGICKDVDECARGIALCHNNAHCVNSIGGFSCHCAHGFAGDGINCQPLRSTENVDKTSTSGAPVNVEETNGNCPPEWMQYCLSINKTCHVDEEEMPQCGSCIFGYQPMGGRCHQIDEQGNCGDPNKNNCNVNADCIDVHPGRHFCTCKVGFIGDGLHCDDVNECTIPGLCDQNAVCNNFNGSFECACKSGFQGNGFICKQVLPEASTFSTLYFGHVSTVSTITVITPITNTITSSTLAAVKCRDNPTVCHPNAQCDWDGICRCAKGFDGDGVYYCNKVIATDSEESPSKKEKDNEDEFAGKSKKKTQNVFTETGTPLFSSSTLANAISTTALPAGSANNNTTTKSITSIFISTLASKTMSISPPTSRKTTYPRCGVITDQVRSDGSDISGYVEIASENGVKCHPLATCDFARGDGNGGVCVCNDGYEGDGYTTCIPAWKDCRRNASVCHYYAKCDSRTGDCVCDDGFLGDGFNSCLPDSWDCEARGSALCSPQATCINRRCACRDGFIGDGITCMQKNLPPHFTANCLSCHCHANCNNVTRKCECQSTYLGNGLLCVPDPQNCVHYPALCHPNANCDAASGKCVCGRGYSGDGRRCTRTASCHTQSDLCHTNARCLPSGNCKCNDGYFGDGQNCTIASVEGSTATTPIAQVTSVSECTIIAQCGPHAECVSGACKCISGYVDNASGLCEDIDECRVGVSHCDANAICRNLEGSYECVCAHGFVGDGFACEPLPIQNIGDLGVQCLSDGFGVSLAKNTTLTSDARVYVRGQSDDPYCSKTFAMTNGTSSDYFHIPMAHCKMRLEENNTIAVTVILQKHAKFFTEQSFVYELRCAYPTPAVSVSVHYNVTEIIPDALTIDGKGPTPTCTLAITNADDALADAAVVGDVLKMSLSVEPRAIYAVLPRNCYAINVASGERYPLTDAVGCSVDTAIFPEWSRIRSYLSQALFRTFKWPDTSMVRFECDCSACFGMCPTVNCNRRRDAAAAFRRRMRLRVARQNHISFDARNADDEPQHDEENSWLEKFAKSGAKSAFSRVLAVEGNSEEVEAQKQIEQWLREGGDRVAISVESPSVQTAKLDALTTIAHRTACVGGVWLVLSCICVIASIMIFCFLCIYLGMTNRIKRKSLSDDYGQECGLSKNLSSLLMRRVKPLSRHTTSLSSGTSTLSRPFDIASEGDNHSSYIKFK